MKTHLTSAQRTPLQLLGCIALLGCLACSPSWALQTSDPVNQPELNWRFLSGMGTANPVPNTNPLFRGLGYDWSSVGGKNWGSGARIKSAALISPMHLEGADHMHFGSGDTVDFFNGQTSSRITVGVTNNIKPSPDPLVDIAISPLARPFAASDHIGVLRLLDISSGNYVNQPGFIMGTGTNASGQNSGTEQIATTRIFGNGAYATLTVTGYSSDSTLTYKSSEMGDSGSPLFITYKGQLTLAGSTYSSDGTSSSLLGQPAAVTTTNNLLATNGYALRYTLYDVPTDTANTANVWTGGAGSGAFGTAGNWSQSLVPSSLPVVFDSSAAGGQTTLTLGADQSLRGVLFRPNTNLTGGFTFSAGNTLSLGTSGLRNEDSNPQTFNSAIALSGGQNWEAVNGDLMVNGAIANGGNLLVVQGTANTTLGGVVSGSGGLAKDESGTLTLNGQNTYTGTTFIHNGTLRLGANNALPTSTMVRFDAANPAVLDLNGKSQTVGKLASVYNGAGTVALNGGALTTGGNNQSSIYAGVFTGSGSVTKAGLGTWILTGDNSGYTGSMTVSGGLLQIANATGSGTVTVNSGATLTGAGNTGGGIVLNSGGLLSPGTSDGGSLTIRGGLVWNGGGTVGITLFEPGISTSLDLGSSALTKGSAGTYQFTFTNGGGMAPGLYTLMDLGSTNFSASDFSYTNAGGFTGQFFINSGKLQFQLTKLGISQNTSLIFQDTFDVPATGQTRTLSTGGGVTNSIITTNPLHAGAYLNTTMTTSGGKSIVTYTPNSAATSWARLAGSVTVGSNMFLTLNGGFDLFIRPNTGTSATDLSWFRLMDLSTISGATGFRMILGANGGAPGLRQEFITSGSTSGGNKMQNAGSGPGNVAGTAFVAFNGNYVYTNTANNSSLFVNGTVTHVAYTFSTNAATGLITAKTFAQTGTGPLDTTTATPLSTVNFYADASVIGANALSSGSWTMSGDPTSAGLPSTSVDYDTIRLYASAPTIFEGINPPGFATWINDFGGTDITPGGDPDHDGISNLTEYVLAGNPGESSPAILPAATKSDTGFVFTFNRLSESIADTTQVFQYNYDLGSTWTEIPIPATTTGNVVITPNTPATGIDQVEVTVPLGSNTKIFGRLKVSQP